MTLRALLRPGARHIMGNQASNYFEVQFSGSGQPMSTTHPNPRGDGDMRSVDKRQTFQFCSWLSTHHRDEFARVLRLGTPSDGLTLMAEMPKVLIDNRSGKEEWTEFPLSLNKRSGQNLLYTTCKAIHVWKCWIPVSAWYLSTQLDAISQTRRTEASRRNAVMVGQAVLHRVAVEFTPTVLVSFNTIATWIQATYGVTLIRSRIGDALRWWAEVQGSPFFFVEWGKEGGFGRSTKVSVRLELAQQAGCAPPPARTFWSPYREPIVSITSQSPVLSKLQQEHQELADEWVVQNAHGMNAVYRLQAAKHDENTAIAKQMAQQRRERNAAEKASASRNTTEHLNHRRVLVGASA